MTKLFISVVLIILFFVTCKEGKNDIPETPTSGTVSVAVDPAYKPIVEQEKEIFQYLYKYATVNDTTIAQERGFQLFLKDSVKLLFASRPLSQNELDFLKRKNVYPKIYEFAQDALVIIFNAASKDTSITVERLKAIANKKADNRGLIVVEDGNGSSVSSIMELLDLSKNEAQNIFSADSVVGVIDYVASHEDAIGLVSSTWINDLDSKRVRKWLQSVKIVGLIAEDSKQAFYPFQSEISDSSYPFRRTIYLISRETKMGIANGFAAFLLGDKGQRIVLKAGLLPSRMPNREVVITKKSIY